MFSLLLAQANDYGLGATAREAGLAAGDGDVTVLAGRIVGTALSMIGVLFFILMIYAGFLWMTARGNEQQIEKAKTTMTAAVIGIIVVLSSYAITRFVFQAVSGGGGGGQSCAYPSVGHRSPQALACDGRSIGQDCTIPGGGQGVCTETPEPGTPDPHCHCQ